MFNFFNQFFLKRIYKGPNTHFVKPKVLNVRFKGNKLPNYTYLDLDDIFSASPELIETEDENKKKQYELRLNLVRKSQVEKTIPLVIGVFQDENLAKTAYSQTITSFLSPSSSILKFFLTLGVIVVALQFTFGFFSGISKSINEKNAQLQLIAAKEEADRKKQEKATLFQEVGRSINSNPGEHTNLLQKMSDNPGNNPLTAPQVTPSVELHDRNSKEQFDSVQSSLEQDIEKIRQEQQGKKSEKTAPELTPGDLLLKELGNN